ncbi:hypothetical protein CKY03_03785 [Photorhabdus sp. S9-53]|nr:hypothetical protein CKY03_03785 [Photorhabdus sp. S9-53]
MKSIGYRFIEQAQNKYNNLANRQNNIIFATDILTPSILTNHLKIDKRDKIIPKYQHFEYAFDYKTLNDLLSLAIHK